MIPRAFITEWTATAPWKSMDQVEQALVICRSLVELFSDDFLAENLAFRGGTAIHKLYLKPQARYSVDIDLVQTIAGPFGPVADKIQERLSFLGTPRKNQKENNFTLVYRFEAEFQPFRQMKLKVETNCREHDSVLGYKKFPLKSSQDGLAVPPKLPLTNSKSWQPLNFEHSISGAKEGIFMLSTKY